MPALRLTGKCVLTLGGNTHLSGRKTGRNFRAESEKITACFRRGGLAYHPTSFVRIVSQVGTNIKAVLGCYRVLSEELVKMGRVFLHPARVSLSYPVQP